MELYQLIATINNTSTTFTFEFLPENFEGVKISQKFSFKNPIGYTPKFSVDTMRIIKTDKDYIDATFDTFGLESDVIIEIQKLKSTGFGYDSVSTFAIDFESYEKFDEYSEFALKSISAIDAYNVAKNTERQILLSHTRQLPTTLSYINYVSLKSTGYDSIGVYFYEKFALMAENNPSVIKNTDIAIETPAKLYTFKENTNTNYLRASSSANLDVSFTGVTSLTARLRCVLQKNEVEIFEFFDEVFDVDGGNIQFSFEELSIPFQSFVTDDVLYIKFELGSFTGISANFFFDGDFFFDMKLQTQKQIIGGLAEVKYNLESEIIDDIFGAANVTNYIDFDSAITGGNHLRLNSDYLIYKPKDFLNDLCLTKGLIVNFKTDGKVYFNEQQTYFDSLLTAVNAVEIVDFKDLSVKFSDSFKYAGISVGQEKQEYDFPCYMIDWHKVITFAQNRANVSDVLELNPSKLRCDLTGLINDYFKRGQKNQSVSKDMYYLDTINRPFTSEPYVYDYFTPRDIAENWRRFSSFAFQNFGKDTLTLSSNGGTTDDLQISGVNQMDDIVLDETPRLLPIGYNLTGLVSDIDFSEHILKIYHDDEWVYLFVYEANTTDKLSEQNIKALKIQF